jgi:hypothetical protein
VVQANHQRLQHFVKRLRCPPLCVARHVIYQDMQRLR